MYDNGRCAAFVCHLDGPFYRRPGGLEFCECIGSADWSVLRFCGDVCDLLPVVFFFSS